MVLSQFMRAFRPRNPFSFLQADGQGQTDEYDDNQRFGFDQSFEESRTQPGVQSPEPAEEHSLDWMKYAVPGRAEQDYEKELSAGQEPRYQEPEGKWWQHALAAGLAMAAAPSGQQGTVLHGVYERPQELAGRRYGRDWQQYLGRMGRMREAAELSREGRGMNLNAYFKHLEDQRKAKLDESTIQKNLAEAEKDRRGPERKFGTVNTGEGVFAYNQGTGERGQKLGEGEEQLNEWEFARKYPKEYAGILDKRAAAIRRGVGPTTFEQELSLYRSDPEAFKALKPQTEAGEQRTTRDLENRRYELRVERRKVQGDITAGGGPEGKADMLSEIDKDLAEIEERLKQRKSEESSEDDAPIPRAPSRVNPPVGGPGESVTVTVVSPQGLKGTIPKRNLQKALSRGYKLLR